MMYRIVDQLLNQLAFKTAKLDLDSPVLLASLFYYCLKALKMFHQFPPTIIFDGQKICINYLTVSMGAIL